MRVLRRTLPKSAAAAAADAATVIAHAPRYPVVRVGRGPQRPAQADTQRLWARFRSGVLAGAAFLLAMGQPAQADQVFPATLAGHSLLAAETFVPAPLDAPADLKVSGKFTENGLRTDAVGSVMGRSAGRPTGVRLPFRGQPVQGFSGIRTLGDGTFLATSDNGFGNRLNSPDAMLLLFRLRPDFAAGRTAILETIFLHDPDRKVPFRIANEGTGTRYLTGADFDIEGVQLIDGKLWIGDEFGPYLIRADRNGKVEAVFETMVDGKLLRSPDHHAVRTPNRPDMALDFNHPRTKGFEGLAASPDGRFLYGLLEGPIWDAAHKRLEERDGKQVLRVLEFDVAKGAWTGRHWFYPLEQNGLAIGDFNMLDATTALVIERDDGEGTPDRACPAGQRADNCFHNLPKFKRVYKIEMGAAQAGAMVRKIGHIDLLDIRDPNGNARKPLVGGVFQFPFFTIENVDRVDARHIIVGNDNNLPFSSSRDPNRADDNELILLEVEAFLNAR